MTLKIRPSGQEITDLALSNTHLVEVVAAVEAEGFCVLQQVVPHRVLDGLQTRMAADTVQLLEFLEANGGNPRARGHLQQGPPPYPEYVFAEVVINSFAVQVAKKMLGEHAFLSFYNGNTNCPGSELQHVHLDGSHLWPHWEIATPTCSLVINVPPADCTLENGAIELWPGTHRMPGRYDGGVKDSLLEERRKNTPPVQVTTQKGDLLIRDVRLWHRGVPNESNEARQMIAMVYVASFMKKSRKLKFQTGCEEALETGAFDVNAEYTKESVDYLFGPSKTMYESQAAN